MGTILCQNLQQDRKEVSDHCSGLDFKIEGPIMQFDGAVLSNAVGDSSGGYGKGDDKSLGIASNGGIDQLRDNDEPDMEWDALWRILSEPGPSLQTSQVPQQQVEDTMPQDMTVGGFQVRELEDHAYHTIPEELDIAGYEYNGFEGSNAPQDVAETGDLAGHIYEHNFLQPRATEDLYQYTNGRMVYHDYQEAGGTTLDLGNSAWTLEASGMQPGSYYEEEHESLHDQDYGSELSCSTTSAQKVACLDDDSDAETVNNTIDYERPRRSDGSVLASDCKTSSSSLDSKSKLAKSSIRNGTTSNSLKGTIIEIDSDSDEDFEDDEDCKVSLGPSLHGKRKMTDWPVESVKRLERPTTPTPAVMHLRAMEKTFLTPTQTISAHRLLGAGYGKGGGYNYEAIKHEKRTLTGSILDIKHGPPPPFGGNPPNGMVGEDKSLRTIVQRMLSGDEKEEACLEEGLMAVPLLKHQKIALAWMEKCEKRIECAGGILADDQGLGKTVSTIALILKVRAPINKFSEGNYASPESKVSAIDLDEEDDDYLSNTPTRKMIESIEPEMDEVKDEDLKLSSKRRPMAGTLVVCPTSVLRQWAHELRQKVTPAADLSILIYHGSNRTKDPDELARHDVVLTTYSIVTMEVPKQPLPDEKDEDRRSLDHYGLTIGKKTEDSKKGKMKGRNKIADDKNLLSDAAPLSRVSWFRVVLDEAQSIKNCRTQVARACWGLRAKRRWCLSGTPIQNAIDDLYSYFRFLRFDPLDAYKSFRAEIKEPIVRNPAVGYKKLQGVLQAIMLRRTKNCLIDGKPIVNLPARIVKLQQADFTDDEREFYSKLEAESRRKFEAYAEEGTLQSNYVNILWMLLRLRQACDHPLLVAEDKSEVMETHAVEFMKKLPASQQIHLQHILESNQAPCTICSDAPEEAVVSACGHVFCQQCISEKLAIGDDSTCPFPKCRVHLNQSSLYSLAALKGTATGNSKPAGKKKLALALRGQSWKTSSKIEAVMRIILSLPKISPDPNGSDGMGEGNITNEVRTEKAIVFSQWTSMLDLLETPLKCAGLSFRRLDGTMTVSDRDNAVSEFNTNPKVTVMIMSLKAASLGLNMVAACHVLLLDVWWNPTTEDQAIDRAHRIGQTRTVHVSRFTVKNTIEDRILALQEKKRQMVASAFGENGGDSQRSRLTTEDLRFLFSV